MNDEMNEQVICSECGALICTSPDEEAELIDIVCRDCYALLEGRLQASERAIREAKEALNYQ